MLPRAAAAGQRPSFMASGIREHVLQHLATRPTRDGETVEFGWFIFNVVKERSRLDIETLGFKEMASFTRDFTVVEEIYAQQMQLLGDEGVEPCPCRLWDRAILSKSYSPGHPKAYALREFARDGNLAGWNIGIEDDALDLSGNENLVVQSLYEVSIKDRRFLPIWLLPVGYTVSFDCENRRVGRP
jgi:hypothetical protein